jgi:hypothetical protein
MTRPSRAEAARLTVACACATVGVGLTVLIGWSADVDAMQRLFVSRVHMLPITALTFVVAAVSLWMQRRSIRDAGAPWLAARTLALVVFAVGAVTLGERLFGWDAGIDALLFPEALRALPYRPIGLMATNSAICFTLAGGALFLLDGHTRRVRQTAQWFSTLGIGLAALALIGYLYGARRLYQLDGAAEMSLATALGFFVLNAGILGARPGVSWAGRLVSRTGTGMLARRLLLALTIVPVALGWLFLQARDELLVSREVGTAILVLVMMAIQLTVLLRAAAIVQRGERAQSTAL